jgi:ornithine decarboxylase
MQSFKPEQLMSKEQFSRIREFSKDKETPFLLMDLDVVGKKYDELRRMLPQAKIYYAVKANPMDEVVTLLASRGSNFDIATRQELDQLLRLGISTDRMSFGNTIKKEKDVKYAYEQGIRLFATDSHNDLHKIARSAPGSKVFFRLKVVDISSEWTLSRKFGTDKETIMKLIRETKNLGLVPYGLSFHVGSQKTMANAWSDAIYKSHQIFQEAEKEGIKLKMLNLGGGLPADYYHPIPYNDDYKMVLKHYNVENYLNSIKSSLSQIFGKDMPEILMEPGRSIAGDAGVIVSEIILISRKKELKRKESLSIDFDGRRRITPNSPNFGMKEQKWIYFDVGKFGGLAETLDESINYPIYVDGRYGKPERAVLAGPTCDSADILYEKHPYYLPNDVKEGDTVYIFSTGAYTQSYSSIGFNGIPPLKAYVLPRKRQSSAKKSKSSKGQSRAHKRK